ncbi:MAG: hypothetical protein NTV75_09165, partial [Bacteroidia bacterium]|nr:hypothetical protein [Bacteroidia bacterium]
SKITSFLETEKGIIKFPSCFEVYSTSKSKSCIYYLNLMFKFSLTGEKGRFIRLLAKNGQRGFLFTDEVIVY